MAPRKLASFSPLDMSSAPRKTQASEQKINQQCRLRLPKTQNYFLPVDDNQVSTVFCVIGLQKPAFEAVSDTKNRDFSLSWWFFVALLRCLFAALCMAPVIEALAVDSRFRLSLRFLDAC